MLRALFAEALSRKSVPEVKAETPRPAALKVTPLMFKVDVPVSLKVSLRSSPFNRLMPLKEASREVVLIWLTTSLNCLTRLLRTVWEDGSLTGVLGVTLEKVLPTPVEVPPIAPIVAERRIIAGDDADHAVRREAGLQVVGRQRVVEVVQAFDLTDTRAKRNGGGRTASGRTDGQGLTVEDACGGSS